MKIRPFAFGMLLIFLISISACASTPSPDSAGGADSIEKTAKNSKEPEKIEPPKTPDVIFVEKLQSALAKGDLEGAIGHFETIPEELKDNTDMKILQASLLLSANRTKEAAVIASELKAKDPSNKEVLELNAQIALASGDSQAQNAAIKQLLAADPNNAAANIILGDQQQIKKKYKLALNNYRRALISEPDNHDALYGYGKMCWYTGDMKSAKETFNKMYQMDKNDTVALSYLGKLSAEDENYKNAIDYIEKAIKLEPNTYDFFLDYGSYLRNVGRYADAEKAWSKAIQIDPTYFLGYAYRAGLYDEQDKFKQALADYHMVVKTNPSYYFAYEEIGILEFHEKNWAVARAAFSKANSIKSQSAYQLMIMATYIKENNLFEAKKMAQNIMKNMNRESLDYKMIRLYHDQGPANAENTIATALDKETDKTKRGKMLFYFALYYQMRGSDAVAKEYYSKVTKMQTPLFFEYRLAEWAEQEL